mgnify:CR=1 FL=1
MATTKDYCRRNQDAAGKNAILITKTGNRNAKRLVYSNDGLIYYTDDHYKSFENCIKEAADENSNFGTGQDAVDQAAA